MLFLKYKYIFHDLIYLYTFICADVRVFDINKIKHNSNMMIICLNNKIPRPIDAVTVWGLMAAMTGKRHQ